MNLLRHFGLWAALLLLAACTRAAPINHTVWKIEKAGAPTSYLVGTIHFGASGSELSPQLRQILLDSQALMTENTIPVNQAEAMQPEMLALMQSTMNLNDKDALRRTLGNARYIAIKKSFEDHPAQSMLLPVFDHLQPWAVLMYCLSAPPEGYDSESGIDYLLSKSAQAHNIRRLALEKTEQSLNAFKSLPEDKILSALDMSLTYQQETEADTLKLIRLYHQGKIAELLAWSGDEQQALKYLPAADKPFWRKWFYHTVLDQRTQNWIPPILAQLPKEKTVIAVGLMHLDGKNGLIAQLRSAGYTVTAVP